MLKKVGISNLKLLFSIFLFSYFAYSYDKLPFILIFFLSTVKFSMNCCKKCEAGHKNKKCNKMHKIKKVIKFPALNAFYVSAIIMFLLNIKKINSHLLMWLFVAIWSFDLFLYLSKSMFSIKRHKLLLKAKNFILIKGSLEDFVIAIVGSFVISLVFASFTSLDGVKYLAPVVCILAQISIPVEHFVKKKFGIKRELIMSGRGSMLRCFDGLFLPAYFLILLFGI